MLRDTNASIAPTPRTQHGGASDRTLRGSCTARIPFHGTATTSSTTRRRSSSSTRNSLRSLRGRQALLQLQDLALQAVHLVLAFLAEHELRLAVLLAAAAAAPRFLAAAQCCFDVGDRLGVC